MANPFNSYTGGYLPPELRAALAGEIDPAQDDGGGGGEVDDASTTVKGIVKLSAAPVSASEPIAVGDNDSRLPTAAEKAALAGTGTPSGGNKYVTADNSALTNDRTADGIRTATTVVAVSEATAPTSGQVLKASGTEAATWDKVASTDLKGSTSGSASAAAGFNVTLPTSTTNVYVIRVGWTKVSGTTGFVRMAFGAGAGSAPTNVHMSYGERTSSTLTSGTGANANLMNGSVTDKGTFVLTLDKNSKTWTCLVAGKATSGASAADVQFNGGGWDTDDPTIIRIENSGASASFNWTYSVQEG